MRGLAVLTVAFVFASTALFVGPAQAQSSGSATLQGTVCLGYGTGPQPLMAPQPGYDPCMYQGSLPGATVRLTRSSPVPGVPLSSVTATSDANGIYRFTGLQAGEHQFTATRAGFQDVTGTVTVAAGSVQDVVMAGKSIQATGRILGQDGAPLSGAKLSFCCVDDKLDATTGADGRYSATVTGGRWSVSVSAAGYPAISRQLLLDGAGDIDFVLQPLPAQDARVSGTVRDQDGNPVPRAEVAISHYGGCCVAYDSASSDPATGAPAPEARSSMPYAPYYYGENYTVTDEQGRFTIGAYAGENGLRAGKEGYAGASVTVRAVSGQTVTNDLVLQAFPAKTARIEGRIVDDATGKAVRYASIQLYSPEFGVSDCSVREADGGGSSGSGGSIEPMPAEGEGKSVAPDSSWSGCSITVRDDGTFEGLVTPGYAILTVYNDWYSSCSEFPADGGMPRGCDPEYSSWTRSLRLAANGTTEVDVRLRARPGPDAEVSGYVLDEETGAAVPGARITFSNQDSWGWGSAVTDEDGSYRILLRSGYHSVSIDADGHLPWQGVLEVDVGDNAFDASIAPGQAAYSWCCYGPYSGGVAYAGAEDKAGAQTGSGSGTALGAPSAERSDGDSESSQQGLQYQDLGGGLGPYDATKRASQTDSQETGNIPGAGLLLALAALGAVLVLRRRRA